jgi:hypothetical protein
VLIDKLLQVLKNFHDLSIEHNDLNCYCDDEEADYQRKDERDETNRVVESRRKRLVFERYFKKFPRQVGPHGHNDHGRHD